MNEQILRQRYPDADPQQIAWAAQSLERLRTAIRRFQMARLKTGELRAGLVPAAVPPSEVSRYLALYRDAELERRTVEDLRSLLHGILGREPTMDELEAGVPDENQLGQLGLLPAVIGIVALIGGSAVLTNAFEAMTAHEDRVRTEILARTPALQESWYSRLWSSARGPVKTVAVVAAVGAAGYIAWELLGKKYVSGLLPAKKEPLKNPDEDEEPEELEEKEEDHDDDSDE